MTEEKMKFGHSVRINFEFPQIEIKEIKPVIIKVEKDLILKHLLEGEKKESIQLIIPPHANVTIIEEFNGESKYADFNVKIVIGENALVNFQSKQDLSEKSTLNQNYAFYLDQSAKLNLLNVLVGCCQLKHKTIVHLEGEGAECQNNCVYFARNEQKFIIETSNIHNAKQTTSNMLTKGVLDDKSKTINTGVVRIEPNAWGSNGYQRGDHLLLSKAAEVNPIPELQIQNHDVKCSHGVSITKIDDEKLFYFTSRGIPKETATAMFVQGFISPTLKFLPDNTKEEILNDLFKRSSQETFINRSEAEVNESL